MTSIYKIPIVVLLTFVVVFASSCKKRQSNEDKGPDCKDGMKYISSDITKFKFIKGTYWQYIDSVNLAVDSLAIDTAVSGISSEPSCSASLFEYYTYKTTDYPLNTSETYNLTGVAVYRNTNALSGFPAIYYDYVSSAPGNFGTCSLSKQDSLFVYDRYYQNIVKVVHYGGQSSNKIIYYSNSAFGVLRKEVYDTSGSLLSKKILKNKVIVR